MVPLDRQSLLSDPCGHMCRQSPLGRQVTILMRSTQSRSTQTTATTSAHPLGRWTWPSWVAVVGRRIARGIPLFFVVTALSFLLVSLTPGDAARAILGDRATADEYARLHHALGLDQPLYEQYGKWIVDAAHGDLGTSLYSGQSVSGTILERLPVTFSLIAGALIGMVLLGVAFGATSAARGGLLARFVDGFSLLGFAVPSFWAGALLIALFAVRLGWLPPTGYVRFADSPFGWAESLVLPVTALAISGMAAIAKQTREAMLDALASEYVRMARVSGVSPASIVLRHALKNSSIRIVTVIGLQAVGLLGGTVIIESVFALPGVGSLAVNAVLQQDLPVIQGVVVVFTVVVVIINLIVDLSYAWLNPKVRMK